MREYIKKLSYSLCLLEQVIKDIKFKEGIKDLSMSLIKVASCPKLQDLRILLVQTIDFLDLAKLAGVVSVMNAEVIISATLKLIEEIDTKTHHQNSYLLPKLSLSEMSDKLLRDRVRDEEQNKFLNEKFSASETDIFKMTRIPEFFATSPADKEVQKTEAQEKVVDEKAEPKFSWGNGSQQPLVYTFFGSEDKIIEDRKVKLLEILKTGGGVAIGDIAKQFPGLNSKTLQRDLLDLIREKKVIMMGKKRWVKYYLK